MKKQKETGTVVDRQRSGRPKATTVRQDHELVRLSLRDRKATTPELIVCGLQPVVCQREYKQSIDVYYRKI